MKILAHLCIALLASTPTFAQIGTVISPPTAANSLASTDTGHDFEPCLASGNGGVWTCLFTTTEATLTNGGDTDIYWMRSRDLGVTWSTPAPLASYFLTDSNATSTDIEPAIASEGSTRMAVWSGSRFAPTGECGIYSAYGATSSTTWTNVLPVSFAFASDAVQDRNPSVAGGTGTYIVVWERDDSASERDLWFARTTQNGGSSWSAPQRLDSNSATDVGSETHPRIATDGAGNWIVVFQSTEDHFGAGSDSEIYSYRSSDDGVTWSDLRLVNPTGHVDGGASDTEPALAVDTSTGTWLCAWRSFHTFGGATGGESEILCSRSTNNGLQWSTVGQVNSDFATDQPASTGDNDPFVGTDKRGRFMVAWSRTLSNDSDTDLRAARSDDGGLSWTAPDLLDIHANLESGTDDKPQLVADGDGHWLGVWQSNDNVPSFGSDLDVFTARFLTPGPDFFADFCYGYTETGNAPRCPCGNDSSITSRNGCLNSSGSGARVGMIGSYEVSSASESITIAGVPPAAPVLFFQGNGQFQYGVGLPHGDGQLCVGGIIVRLGVLFANSSGNGTMPFTPPGVAPGAIRFYQGWYRDSAAFCTSATFNLSSAYGTVWLP